jgi:hypothetical protein
MSNFRLRLLLPFLAAIVAILPMSAQAASPEVVVFHSGFTMVDATFMTTDATGCVTTRAEVHAIDSRAQHPGGPADYALVVEATVQQWTTCPAYELQFDGVTNGILAGAMLVGPPALTQEALQASLLMTDQVRNRALRLDIDLVWSCPAPAAPSPSTFHEHGSNFTINLAELTRLNYGCVASGTISNSANRILITGSTTDTFVASGRTAELDIFRG